MTSSITEPIQSIVDDTLSTIDLLESLPQTDASALAEYRSFCSKIPDHIRAGRIRIAVVGVIKSGKSTLINALAKKELVKRGAGVVTSITTRIRKGKKNRARIQLKSWDEVNTTLEKALDYFPQARPHERFDIRRKKDRTYLAQVYDTLSRQFPVTREGIRPEALIMRNALQGFNACQDFIEADAQEVVFESKSFDDHKGFTADPSRAFYVQDVCLEVFGKMLPPNIEIADCQGADSTDPAQMAQIISYLESANLIVYCISSRTGLRRSDMGFLKRIKRLGLMENILFVNNCDLTEHENLEDLERIRDGICRELELFMPDPRLFSFSALHILFEGLGSRLTKRNAKRLSLWREDKKMADLSSRGFKGFSAAFDHILETRRFDLLVANHLERLRIVTEDLDKKIRIMDDLLAMDLGDQDRARTRIAEIEENARRLRVIVDNSIQGAVSGLNREIETNLEKAFLKDRININRRVAQFINDAKIDPEPYRTNVQETGFKQILYFMFQDFKQQLDLFALEEVLPELKRLVGSQEKRVQDYFQSLLDSYQIDFFTPSGRDREAFPYWADILDKDQAGARTVDIASIKKILGLSLPAQVFTVRLTPRIRANVLTNFGCHSVGLFFLALMDKHVRFSFTPGLNRAAARIKKESLSLVRNQIRDYHQALILEYFSPLIRAVTRDFKDKIIQRFAMYESLSRDMEDFFTLKQDEKAGHRKIIQEAGNRIRRIEEALDRFLLKSAS